MKKHYWQLILLNLKTIQSKKCRKYCNRIVIFYCGAGRGSLMKCALRAAEKAKANVFIYLVKIRNTFEIIQIEKNPNAVITLNYLVNEYFDELGNYY